MTTPFINLANSAREEVRVFDSSHAGEVARLFHKTFRGNKGPVAASLAPYLREIFLEHPWHDPELPSLVHVAEDGRVDGFIGVLPLRLTFEGRRARAAIAGSLMVNEPEKNPLTGAKLMRKFILGPQDITITESANAVAQSLHAKLRGRLLPLTSMEWFKVFKPFGTGVALASRSFRAAKFLAPFARLGDGLLSRVKTPWLEEARPASSGLLKSEDVDAGRFAAFALRSSAQFALRPDWDESMVNWLLTHAAKKETYGPMICRLVYGRGDAPIGGYVVYLRPGGMAWVLQIFAEMGRADPVVDDLVSYARSRGALAVRGRSQPMLMESLLKRGCVFMHRSATIVHTNDEALMAAASGNSLINGLAAESWSRLIGGEFR